MSASKPVPHYTRRTASSSKSSKGRLTDNLDALHALNILLWSVAASTAIAFGNGIAAVVCLAVAGAIGLHASLKRN